MVQLVQIRQRPSGRIDPRVISRLERSLGAQRSREVVEDACFEIIERLTRFEVAHAELNAAEAHRLARAVVAIGEEVGMEELAEAARAAAVTQSRSDPIARAATAQRLLRVGEASLDTILTACKGEGHHR